MSSSAKTLLRVPPWAPPIVFAALAFGHTIALPTFEGMDEPAHLSSILHFAAGRGRPVPGVARLHAAVERAVALAPGPYHQWEYARARLGGSSYAEWRRLPSEEKRRRNTSLSALAVAGWEDGEHQNWQAQHPPLYYAVVGVALRAAGVSRFSTAHRMARLLS